MKKNSTMLIGLIVVIIVAIGAYAIFHKSSSTSSSTNAYGTTTPATTTKPAATKSGIIQVKTSSSVGQYLADSNGNALYTYGGDKAGVSNCSGACVANWPIYKPGSTTSLPTNVTVITRSDGSSQYAYKDLPLYTFTGDSAGQVTGDGVSDFHIAKP